MPRLRLLLAAVGPVLVVAAACSSTSPSSTPATPTTAAAAPTATETAGAGSAPGTTVVSGAAGGFDEQTRARFTQALVDARARFGFAGVQAGVWTPEHTWIASSGTAGPNDERPPQRKDHTRIGSITKTFTTTLVLQLVADGKLSLDDRINQYVPGVPNGATATIRQLMDMTSGIPSYTDDEELLRQVIADPNADWLPNELVSVVSGKPAAFEAGADWGYSNTNAVLLGMVIEKVTGQTAATVLRERILVPLELDETSLPANGLLPEPHLAGVTSVGQADGETTEATDWNPSWAFTSGAMVSTLDDLHRWGEALGTGEGILQPEVQRLRMSSFRDDHGYGLGLERDNGWIGHTGTIPGYNTVLRYHPDLHATIVVMVNDDRTVDGQAPAPAVFADLARALDPAAAPSGTAPR